MKSNITYSLGCFFRLAWGSLLLIAVLVLLKHFVFDVMPVSGASMFPNFHDRDVIVLNKISYVIGEPKRGDNIVLRFPGDPDHERYIKRLIGMPGEKVAIRQGRVYINDKPLFEPYLDPELLTDPEVEVTLKDNEYYLIGDNRPVSSDSRIWGPAYRDNFIGKAFFIVLPFGHLQPVPSPVY